MKILAVFFLTAVMIGTGVLSSLAASPDRRFDPLNETCRKFQFSNMREGAALFKKVCQSCHNATFDNGLRTMTVFFPRVYSPGQWTRFFTTERPQCSKDGSWDGIPEEDLLKLNDYLYKGAYGTWDTFDALEFC